MTNLEVYKKAIEIEEDIVFNDCRFELHLPAVAATILFQLLEEKENKNETV